MSGILLPYRNHLPRIAPDAFVAPNAALIGRVEVLAHANIWFGCTLRGDVGLIHQHDKSASYLSGLLTLGAVMLFGGFLALVSPHDTMRHETVA